MKLRVETSIARFGEKPTVVTAPATFETMVKASESGGYITSYTGNTPSGRVWQGWKCDENKREIVCTHVESGG